MDLSLRDRLLAMASQQLRIASMVKAELLCGVAKSQQKEKNTRMVAEFLRPFEVVPFEDEEEGLNGLLSHAVQSIR